MLLVGGCFHAVSTCYLAAQCMQNFMQKSQKFIIEAETNNCIIILCIGRNNF